MYGEDHRWRHVFIVVVILAGTLLAALWKADKLPDFLNFGNQAGLQSQLLNEKLTSEELDYLENESGYIPFDERLLTAVTPESLKADLKKLMESFEPRPTTKDEAIKYLTEELFAEPIPATIVTVMTAAAEEFFGASVTSTPPPTTRLLADEFDYLENESGYIPLRDLPLENVTLQSLEQDLIEILLTADPKPATMDAGILYLKEELFTDPIPASIAQVIGAAAEKSLKASPPPSTVGSTFTPTTPTTPATPPTVTLPKLIDQVLSILANHQVVTNNYQAVQRSQAANALLREFIIRL